MRHRQHASHIAGRSNQCHVSAKAAHRTDALGELANATRVDISEPSEMEEDSHAAFGGKLVYHSAKRPRCRVGWVGHKAAHQIENRHVIDASRSDLHVLLLQAIAARSLKR